MNRFAPASVRFVASISLLCLFAAPAASQQIDGQLVRNPDGTITYSIEVAGPPNGLAALFVAPALLPTPIDLPPFGNLLLDPNLLLATPALQLDAQGRANVQFTIDPARTLGASIFFQPVFLDLAGTQPVVRLGANARGFAQQNAAGAVENFAAAMTPGVGCDVQVWGPVGQNYTILIRDAAGRVVAERTVAVGANGTTGNQHFAVPGIGAGYRYEVWKDIGHGHIVMVWSGTW